MTSIIFVTQLVDPGDPALGFVTGWVDALAARFAKVWVIANEVRHDPWPRGNVEVISLGKERGRGRASRCAAYVAALARLVPMEPSGLLAHMCPVYLNLAAPIAKPSRIPLLLWFAHPADSPTLRLSERLADAILTSLPGAFPGGERKVRVIGQAIDLELFRREPIADHGGSTRLIAIGRTSPSKGFITIIDAVATTREKGIDVRLRIVGPSTTDAERQHRCELEGLIGRRRLEGAVTLEPGLPPAEIPRILRSSDVLVNSMIGGSGDKVVFEAMAMGRAVIVSNPSFRLLLADLPLDPTFPHGDATTLGERIQDFEAAPHAVRAANSTELRSRVERGHSREHWASQVSAAIAEIRGRSKRRWAIL